MSGRRFVFLLVVAGLLGPLTSRAQAASGVSLDPFARRGAASRPALDPFRVAAAPATPAAATTPPPAPSPAPALGAACTTDEQCPDGTICDAGRCQVIQRSTNVAWLYYREGAFLEVLGLYWSKRGPSGYTYLAPFYWHTWSPQSRSHIVAPLFWRFEDQVRNSVLLIVAPLAVSKSSPDSSFTWVAPLNFGWRNKDHEHQLIFPLFYGSRHKNGGAFVSWFGYQLEDGARRQGSVLWAFWWGEDTKERTGYNILFPLLWDFREGEERSTVFFPLVWSYASAGTNSTIVGNIVHLRRPTWSFDTVFPVWWSGQDNKSGSAFKMLVPFFYWRSAGNGRRSAWISPIGGYSRDDDARSRMLTLLPLLTFWRRDADSETRVFTPLYISHRSDSEDSTTHWLGLALFYRRDDPRGSTMAVTPLFWRFHDAQTDAKATALLPFFARRVGPRDTTTVAGVLPFVWGYKRTYTGGGWSGGLFPLAFFGENAGRSHAVVAPLFWRWAGANDSTTLGLPLFYWHRDAQSTAGGVPLALTFWGAQNGESYAFQVPLFWRFASERGGWSTTVVPPLLGYYHRDADGWSGSFGPIFGRVGQKRSHAILFPLFWRFRDADQQKTTTVVGPYWHRSWGGETTDALFPLIHYRRGARPGGADETSFTFFPLVHYHRDANTRVLATLIGASARGPNRQAGFLGPYFWYKDATLDASFVPLLYADVTRRDTGERTRQIGPWFRLDGPGHRARVLFPLFGRYVDEKETDTYVFPSFFRQRRADGSTIDALLPLFWRSSGNGRSATVIGPWYDRTGPDYHNTGLVPLWFHARNAERSLTVIPPLLFVRHRDYKEDKERVWCALLWHSRDRDHSTTTLFPIYWAQSRPESSYKVLFPVFWRFQDTAAGTTSTYAMPFYWASWGTGHTRGLPPIFWYSRDPASGSGTTALLPLFYEAHGPQKSAFMTLLGGYRRTPTTSFKYAGPIIPIWFSHTRVLTETRTNFFLPLLYFSRTAPDRELHTVLGLFWRAHDVTSSSTVILPLFYDLHDFHLARTTVFVPFFLRHTSEADHSTTWLAPLFYRRTSPTDSTTVGFPLVWDFKTGADRRTTLVLPFVARWRRPDHVSTWVFPTIYHRTGLTPGGAPDGTWRTIVAPFYDASVKRPGDFAWDVLGGLFGHERIGRNRFLKLFFIRFEQEPAPRAQTAWYSQPTRTSRRSATRGLSTNVW